MLAHSPAFVNPRYQTRPIQVIQPALVKLSKVNTLPKAKSQAKDKRAKDRQKLGETETVDL
jgi:hypothetical protein